MRSRRGQVQEPRLRVGTGLGTLDEGGGLAPDVGGCVLPDDPGGAVDVPGAEPVAAEDRLAEEQPVVLVEERRRCRMRPADHVAADQSSVIPGPREIALQRVTMVQSGPVGVVVGDAMIVGIAPAEDRGPRGAAQRRRHIGRRETASRLVPSQAAGFRGMTLRVPVARWSSVTTSKMFGRGDMLGSQGSPLVGRARRGRGPPAAGRAQAAAASAPNPRHPLRRIRRSRITRRGGTTRFSADSSQIAHNRKAGARRLRLHSQTPLACGGAGRLASARRQRPAPALIGATLHLAFEIPPAWVFSAT